MNRNGTYTRRLDDGYLLWRAGRDSPHGPWKLSTPWHKYGDILGNSQRSPLRYWCASNFLVGQARCLPHHHWIYVTVF